jgi:hypothetical protein
LNRLAPWQRINIAMARGVLLKASGTMKWTANVDVHGVTPQDSAFYSLFPIEADSATDAARSAAQSIASALYGSWASPSFINEIEPQLFMANVGVYQGGGVTAGRSLRILIRQYHGVQ